MVSYNEVDRRLKDVETDLEDIKKNLHNLFDLLERDKVKTMTKQ